MNKKLIILILLLAGVTSVLPAQVKWSGWATATKAEATFNMFESAIRHRHKIWLGHGNSMTVELAGYEDYQKLQDVEAFLAKVQEDLAFVKDSISECPECSYRIDYLSTEWGMKSYRLQRFEPQGTFLFQKNKGERRPFKPEADTVRFTIMNNEESYKRCQVTFILNRYGNLDSLLADKGKLNGIIDTFRKRSAPRRHADKKWPWTYKSTIFMYKNGRDTNKMVLDYRPHLDKNLWEHNDHKATFDAIVNFGAGFVKDRLAPVGELGLLFRVPGTTSRPTASVIGLYASGYFVFEKNSEGRYDMKDNWFINAEIGDEGNNEFTNSIKTSRLTVGAGYLVSRKGDYFNGTTMKIFMNIRLRNGFTFTPEIIATDNFRQVFPGITFKIL